MLTEEQQLAYNKLKVGGNINSAILDLNKIKEMVDKSENTEDVIKAKTYFEFVLTNYQERANDIKINEEHIKL